MSHWWSVETTDFELPRPERHGKAEPRVKTTVYLEAWQTRALGELHRQRRLLPAAVIRAGVELILERLDLEGDQVVRERHKYKGARREKEEK